MSKRSGKIRVNFREERLSCKMGNDAPTSHSGIPKITEMCSGTLNLLFGSRLFTTCDDVEIDSFNTDVLGNELAWK